MVIINNNNTGYILVLFLRIVYSPFIIKTNNNNNGVNIELRKTNRLKALCMMQIGALNEDFCSSFHSEIPVLLKTNFWLLCHNH